MRGDEEGWESLGDKLKWILCNLWTPATFFFSFVLSSLIPFFISSFLLPSPLSFLFFFLLSSSFIFLFIYLIYFPFFKSIFISISVSSFVRSFLPLIAHFPLQCLHHFGFALSSLLITCGKHSAALLSQAWAASSRAASKIGSHPPRCLLTPGWEEEKEEE